VQIPHVHCYAPDMSHDALTTGRLRLVPVTLALVEATMQERFSDIEHMLGANLPRPWPGRALIEQAFSASLDAIRADADARLWGDRIAIALGPAGPLVVGSVIFHGRPDASGMVEVGYGVFQEHQGHGYATEATEAQVQWALTQPGVLRVRATTPAWHRGSVRVLEKIGFKCEGPEHHEALGEVLAFCIHAPAGAAP
jgi:[ribosomal protein S5]-alanine N-acetyltransferase